LGNASDFHVRVHLVQVAEDLSIIIFTRHWESTS